MSDGDPRPALDRLWAGWRSPYIESIKAAGDDCAPASAGPAPAFVSEVRPPPPGDGSLFERILSMSDAEGFIVHRGDRCSALLNAYPYTSGHLLIVPNRAVPELSGLTDDEHRELWEVVRSAVAAVQRGYGCAGVNVGMNLGAAAGAGVPDHLHAHVLPRWAGDSNFMTAVAETRVMPENLSTTWTKVRDAWPTPDAT